MSSSVSQMSPVSLREDTGGGGTKRDPCPLHGCKRVYTDTSDLDTHIREHALQTQTVPGKILLCSSLGCDGSFSDMSKLMEHMRHHHKPNIFFLCESCRTKLRSYRGLLTHLHTCSKVPRSRSKVTESAAAPDHRSQDASPQHPDPGARPRLPSPSGTPTDTGAEAPPLSPEAPPAAPDPGENQSGWHDPVQHAPLSPGSAVVWRKGPGATCSRRILWEHTKGRYKCVQCGQMATTRKDMTQHINGFHNGNRAAEEPGPHDHTHTVG